MLKLPYLQLIEYCIYEKQTDDTILEWLNNKLGLPVESIMLADIKSVCELPKNKRTKKYKELKSYANDLVKYVSDNKAIIEGIATGFGRKEIFNNLIALLSNIDIDKKTAFKIIDKNYRVDLTEYSDLINIMFYTGDWTYMDWGFYFKYLEDMQSYVMSDTLKNARFSSKEDLLYSLGLGGNSIEEGVVMAVRKSRDMFMKIDADTRADTIKAIGEVHGKMQSSYIAMKKEGMLDEGDGSVSNLRFAVDKSTFEPITKPEFEDLMDDEEYIGG
jgi:hypothetical protein